LLLQLKGADDLPDDVLAETADSAMFWPKQPIP
jgi:hypothetical protein